MIVTSKTPFIDLHGEVTSMIEALVNDFIKKSYLEGDDVVLIIHGKSTNILTKEVHEVLKKNKYVEEYRLDNFNLGQTIVKLKI